MRAIVVCFALSSGYSVLVRTSYKNLMISLSLSFQEFLFLVSFLQVMNLHPLRYLYNDFYFSFEWMKRPTYVFFDETQIMHIIVTFFGYITSSLSVKKSCTFLHIQSTLVISKSKGPTIRLRDIRTLTYQICSIEEKTIRTTKFHK